MVTIFISYRRGDTAPYARLLSDRLVARFGAEAVFMDIDDIALGADFPRVLAETLARTDVLLVLIGPDWLGARGADGNPRLDDPRDYVRFEIETAIRLGKRVIPVLVGGAAMPGAAQLPPQLAPLSRYNALEIGDARFDQDVKRLLEAIDPAPAAAGAAAARRGTDRATSRRRALLLGAPFLLAGIGYWALRMLRGNDAGASKESEAAGSGSLDGTWKASVTYGWGATHEEAFVLAVHGEEVLGAAGFLGVARPIVGGTIRGDEIAFSTRTQEILGRDATRELTHHYRGKLSGDSIRFLLITEGGSSSGGPVEFTARKTPAP